MAASELRIDPHDGEAKTFEELCRATRDQHLGSAWTPQQVSEYWETKCRPVPPDDPYLSQLRAGQSSSLAASRTLQPLDQQTPTRPASQVGIGPVTLSADPFLTGGIQNMSMADQPAGRELLEQASSRFREQKEEIKQDLKHWSESLYAALGPGDRDRQPRARSILIFVPALMFVWEMLVWTLLQHISTNACWLMTSCLVVVSCTAISMWYLGMRWGPVSLLSLGVLCIISAGLGTYLGRLGWDIFWQELWWMNIGQQLIPTSATTPAGARSDAATLAFRSELGNFNQTSVDVGRSVGFKDTDLFCVAPILSPDSAGVEHPRVNYWAVGINCCSSAGTFTCDSSREPAGGYGVVQLGGGFPCPSCNTEHFQKAVGKAEALYGLVSAPDALFVRWVTGTSRAKLEAGICAVGYSAICFLGGGLLFYFLGWLAWYYGFGKRAPTGGMGMSYSFEDAAETRSKRLQ